MIRSPSTNKCISIDRCKKILDDSNGSACGENEHFSESSEGCQASCYTYRKNENKCQQAAGCVCNKNFVRDTKTGRCVPIEKCPSKRNLKISNFLFPLKFNFFEI
jgi:Trypsin Inhibitor like cysteine rich domain